jgi:FlaA1/EpsC-like NDP-sugar epimerase
MIGNMPELQEKFLKPTEHLRNLKLLEEVSKDSAISQRKLSIRLGVALGVTNACLKSMIKKGYIRARGINHKRIAYYLTPRGFQEKARLAYHFLQHNVTYYIELKRNIASKLRSLVVSGVKRVVFYGAGEAMEIAYITMQEIPLDLIGIVDDDPAKQGRRLFGFTIQSPKTINELRPDAIIVTSIRYRDEIIKKLNDNDKLRAIACHSF